MKNDGKKIPTKQYMVWMAPEDENDCGYFEQFNTIADAVDSHGDVEIYKADIKPIGKYKSQTKIVKIAKRKKKVKVL